jgi:hypothetical protein
MRKYDIVTILFLALIALVPFGLSAIRPEISEASPANVEAGQSTFDSELNEFIEMKKIFNDAEYYILKQNFDFQDFSISYKPCGVVNAWSDPNIVMCTELLAELKTNDLLEAEQYIFHHELAHSLLRVLGFPLWDNEDAADEFAAMLLGQAGDYGAIAIGKAAQWHEGRASILDTLASHWADDRHSLTPQRAKNLRRWIQMPDQLRKRWSAILIPKMKTEALKNVLKRWASDRQGAFVDGDMVADELAKRK